MADVDRVLLSQYEPEILGLTVSQAGVPADADNNSVMVEVIDEATGRQLFYRPAHHTAIGQYELELTSNDTTATGNFMAIWTFGLQGVVKTFRSYYALTGAQPAYDNLNDDMKGLVDSVWFRFADLFDSPNGGPNLATYRQTNWGKGRIAQLLRLAIGRMNTVAQPYTNYSLDGQGGQAFPVTKWGAVLEQALFVEALKHLRRSYVEQPLYDGATIARADRRDYLDRWERVLADEEALLRPQLDHFKIKQMGLGRPAILASGGIYGRYTPMAFPNMAARPRMWAAAF